MLFDLRDREVPMPLTLGCLVGAGIYAIFQGLWSPVLLTIALILVADFNSKVKRLAFAITLSVFAAIAQSATLLICVIILSLWILWELGILGGADVKLLITTLLIAGNPAILIPISVTGGFQGLIASLKKQKEIPFVVSIFCGSLIYVLYPLI